MKRQPSWDKYEVALLIDAYIQILDKKEDKKVILQNLSDKLRLKATIEGVEIDDTFRNLNGMMWQIGFIDCAFKNTGYRKHTPSKLFQSIVDMYKNDYCEFIELLENAKQQTVREEVVVSNEETNIPMVKGKTTFVQWLREKDAWKNKAEYIDKALQNTSKYAMSHRILKKDIYEIENIFEAQQLFEKLRKDKIFKVVYKEDAKLVNSIENCFVEFLEECMSFDDSECDNLDIEMRIIDEVSSKYVYGYRLGSVIERMKLRNYLSEQSIVFEGDDDELEQLLIKNGFVSNGKVFIESKDKQEIINNEIETIFESGTTVIYYETFYEEKIALMMKIHIASPESLKNTLKERRNDLFFAKNFFTKVGKITEDVAVSNEILRVWGNKVTESVDDLAAKLPFIPYEKVKFYISLAQQFVWVSEGVYTRTETISVSDSEMRRIIDYVASEMRRSGYVSLSSLPLEEIIEENYELSEYAILFGVYKKCLSGQYSLQGRIVTEVGTEFDVTTLMQQFCDERDEISLDEAICKVEEFTGVADRRVAYPVLYGRMIRIDEQRFVTQSRINFDVVRIDEQIDRFAKDGFSSIKEVTTFALFPECGYSWNHFLLESYCYRFSNKYSYRTNLFNGRNAGAIVDKMIPWDYQELMAHAVARKSINLNEKNVGQFLYETGYMARSKFGGIKEIIESAKRIREDNN